MIRVRWLAAAALLLAAGCASHPHRGQEAWPQDLPSAHETTSVPFYPQDRYQCGPAALATALSHAGIATHPDALVDDVYLPARRGSLQIEMLAAARRRGAMAYVLEPQFAALLREVANGNPVLVLQNLGLDSYPTWHYAVVIGYDRERRRVILRSGTTQRLEMRLSRFSDTWRRADRWGVVILRPPHLPATGTPANVVRAGAELEASGRDDAAETLYRAARERWTDSPLPHIALANRSLAAGDAAEAETLLRAALEIAPRDVVARNNLAELLSRRGCRTDALREIELARNAATGTAFAAAVERTAQEIAALPDQDKVSRASCLR